MGVVLVVVCFCVLNMWRLVRLTVMLQSSAALIVMPQVPPSRVWILPISESELQSSVVVDIVRDMLPQSVPFSSQPVSFAGDAGVVRAEESS